jgi:hypothetical protein
MKQSLAKRYKAACPIKAANQKPAAKTRPAGYGQQDTASRR